MNKGTFFKVNEGATNCTFSQRAGKRRREVDFWCVAPQKEEGGLPLHPSSPGRGCDRASPGAGKRVPSPSTLEAKRLGPTSSGSPPPGDNSTALGPGDKGHLSNPRVTMQGAALAACHNLLPRNLPTPHFESTLSAFSWG